ncbi:MAG: leucine-rich repeat domain-containing protein [Bacteroidales bacterium]|nr:leucine-rich repeat domain-containing protein [Bacteroidales bacterium]
MDNPTFDKVRDLSAKFYRELPQALQDELYDALHRGIDILDSEPQMTAYMFSFGKMHQAKLEYAFGKLPEEFFEQPEINIIDYGCGQAIGTMCYMDYLCDNGYAQQVKSITLIEPSELSLKRAALHASVFFPDAEIKTVNKTFDELDEADIHCDEDIPTLHILSNVLDITSFDLGKLSGLIKGCLNGYNQFICVGPYFNHSVIDSRMKVFCSLFNGNAIFSKIFDKYEFEKGKAWTAQIMVISVGEPVDVLLSTEVSDEDIENGVEDEFGVVYSRDGKKLLKCLNTELKIYTIKESTSIICNNAFYKCNSLQKITIPDSIISVGSWVFCYCKALTEITIPNSFTHIGAFMFGECISLRKVIIPGSVTHIGMGAFRSCKSLHTITIPDSVTTIGEGAFADCKSLQKIAIPSSIEEIGSNPFCGCHNITIESFSNRYIIENGLLIDKLDNSIISCINNTNYITIPSHIKALAVDAFRSCKSLNQITVPNSVRSFGESVFNECKSLQQITIPDSVAKIGSQGFRGCNSLTKITLPESITSIETWTFRDCTSLQTIEIPDSVTTIGEGAFADCESLQKIAIPSSIEEIGSNPFCGCHTLTIESFSNRYIIENGLLIDKLDNSIISCINNSNYITIPSYITAFGVNAFRDCKSLLKVQIPKSVSIISYCSFSGCTSLQEIILPNSIKAIGFGCFSRCTSLKEISIPDSITCIYSITFQDCKSLQQISLPNTISSINYTAFDGCKSLKQIIVPQGSSEKIKSLLDKSLWNKLIEQ